MQQNNTVRSPVFHISDVTQQTNESYSIPNYQLVFGVTQYMTFPLSKRNRACKKHLNNAGHVNRVISSVSLRTIRESTIPSNSQFSDITLKESMIKPRVIKKLIDRPSKRRYVEQNYAKTFNFLSQVFLKLLIINLYWERGKRQKDKQR